MQRNKTRVGDTRLSLPDDGCEPWFKVFSRETSGEHVSRPSVRDEKSPPDAGLAPPAPDRPDNSPAPWRFRPTRRIMGARMNTASRFAVQFLRGAGGRCGCRAGGRKRCAPHRCPSGPSEACGGLRHSLANRMAPGAGSKDRMVLAELAQRLDQVLFSSSFSMVVLSPPGNNQPVHFSRSAADRTSTGSAPARCERFAMRLEVALEGKHTNLLFRTCSIYQPRVCSSSDSGSFAISRPNIADAQLFARFQQLHRIVVVRCRFHDRPGARFGIGRFEDSRSNKYSLGAQLHHQRRVGGRRDAARREVRHRQFAMLRRPTRSVPAAPDASSILPPALHGPSTVSCFISLTMVRIWRTASTMLPDPASPLVRIMAAPSAIRRSASPRLRAPHTNGTL